MGARLLRNILSTNKKEHSMFGCSFAYAEVQTQSEDTVRLIARSHEMKRYLIYRTNLWIGFMSRSCDFSYSTHHYSHSFTYQQK